MRCDELEKYYLVQYCSPARAGERRLRLEVKHTNKEGEEHGGDFEIDFSAKGFRPGCNPNATPRLTLRPKDTTFSISPQQEQSEASKPKMTTAPDSREQDQGEDAPVAPPSSSDCAK